MNAGGCARKGSPPAYVDGEYWSLGERIGSYGQASRSLASE